MPVLDNPRHEKFAQLRAQQVTASEAYRKSGYKPDDGAASRLSGNVKVKARVTELLLLSAGKCVLSIEEKRNFLARCVRTPIGEIDHTSDLCQERTFIEGQEDTSVKVKMPDKLRAIQLDNDLAVDGAEAGKNRAIEIVIRKL